MEKIKTPIKREELPLKDKPEPDHNAIYLDYGPLLPDFYNQDIIVALIREPECIFCYWELSGEMSGKVVADLGLRSPKLILRVHNLSQRILNDIVLPTPQTYTNVQDNYYLTVLPATQYQLELGFSTDNNEFIPLVKSNIVTTPRRGKAPMTDTTPYIKYENR